MKQSPLRLAGGSGRSPEVMKQSPLRLAGGSGRSPEVMKQSPLALAGGLGRSPEVMKQSPLALAGGLGRSPKWQCRMHIFFYGTLMRGFDLRRRTAIDPLLRLVGQGVVRGALYDLGPYPAAVRAEGTIRGEVYAVTDPVRLLPRVDAVERYLPDDPARSEYVREAAPVALDGAARCTAWIYFYAQPLAGAVWIPSGDYREYLARVAPRVAPPPPIRARWFAGE